VGINMYRVALNLDPSSAIAMTNLARALLMVDDDKVLSEANFWVSKAASCAPRRFKWWSKVKGLVDQRASKDHIKLVTFSKRIQRGNLKRLQDLYGYFRMLKEKDDRQARGYGLEKIVNRLFSLTIDNCYGSYRTSVRAIETNRLQVDGGFYYFEKDFFRVETKWTKKKTTPQEIVLFASKLDAFGVKGLFISIRGFSKEAVLRAYDLRKEKMVLLMDGDELELALQGSPSLDEIIRQKQIAFGKDSNPFNKITHKYSTITGGLPNNGIIVPR
jgi:hypothetical protein